MPEHAERTEEATTGIAAAGSAALAIGGGGAAVLSIIGLSHVLPSWMLAISILCIGGGLVARGLGIMARSAAYMRQMGAGVEAAEVTAGVNPEFLAGCAGVTLGIISIAGVYPVVLSAATVIVFGAALLFGTAPRAEADMHRLGRVHETSVGVFNRANAAHWMIGAGAIALGILALVGLRPEVLTLISTLGLGFTLFLSGTAVGARLAKRVATEYRATA